MATELIMGMGLNDPELTPWDGSFSMPDPGVYLARVAAAEKGQSKGTPPVPQITVTWELIGALGENNQVTDQGAGQESRAWFNLDPSKAGNRRRLKHITNVLGVPVDAKGNFDLAKFVGKEAIISIVATTYKKMDPQTGEEVERESRSVQGEQPVNFETAADEPPAPEPEVKTASAPAAAVNGGNKPQMARPPARTAARVPARS